MKTCFQKYIKNSGVLNLCIYFSQRSHNLCANSNYKVIKAPADGHCMIHAWNMALERSQGTNQPDYKHLCNLISQEFKKNINWYRKFVSDTTDIAKELQKYLQDKHYASDVGDLVLYALANSTETSAMIFKEDGERKAVLCSSVEPSSGQSNNLIKLLKSGQHYDVIVFENSGKKSNILF